MNTKVIGLLSELKLTTKLIELGYIVSVPLGDATRYDFVLEKGGKFFRVQVKTGRFHPKDEGLIVYDAYSSSRISKYKEKRESYQGQVEFIAVYCRDNKKCYLVPIGKAKGSLRLSAKKHGNQQTIIWAKDYEI